MIDQLAEIKGEFEEAGIKSIKSLIKLILVTPPENQESLNRTLGAQFYKIFDIHITDMKFDSMGSESKCNCFTKEEITILKLAQKYLLDKEPTRSFFGGGRRPKGIRWQKDI